MMWAPVELYDGQGPEPIAPPVFDAELPMARQARSWTCSACALDWVMRATGLVPDYTRERAIVDIGYPEQINEDVGLTNVNGPGAALIAVYARYGQPSRQGWLDFDTAYQLAAQGITGQLSGVAWYHWVAIRGVQGRALWIANSAPGYMGVYDVLDRTDYERLGGMSVVWLSA